MIRLMTAGEQQSGALFGGAILESRPIPFPTQAGSTGYSSLFYWAFVQAPRNGEFGLHPHEGFEIMTFVLDGALEHFDTKTKTWTPVAAGGVQVIHAGSGVQHAERYRAGSRAFQIWFDPDLAKTLSLPADYRDYPPESFVVQASDGVQETLIAGPGAPIQPQTPDLEIRRMTLSADSIELPLKDTSTYSIFVLQGVVQLDGTSAPTESFAVIDEQETLTISSTDSAELFIVQSASRPAYRTAAQG